MSSRAPRLTLAAVAAGALLVGPLTVPASAAVVQVQILGINDFHGRLETGTGIPGAAKLAGVIAQQEALLPDSTVFVSAGDNVGASTFPSASQDDAPTIEALNLMGLQAGAVGNHEFDRGYDWLADPETHGLDGEGLAGWPSLGANVGGSDLDASTVVTTASGVKVGLVGVVTQQTPTLVSPDGIEGLTFGAPIAAANTEAARLKSNDLADVVVLLAHEGTEDPSCANLTGPGAFGDIVNGASDDIDAILSGHTHTKYACTVEGMPVLQTGQYGGGLDKLVMTVDTATNDVTAVATAEVVDVGASTATPDPAVAALVSQAVADSDVIGRVPLGEIDSDITRAKNADGSENRGAESQLGNFVADVHLSATQDAEVPPVIAFMNPGGLRADLLYDESAGEGDGVVTYKEAALVQPFANTLNTVSLTGAQIKQVLEQQWQPTGSSRPFLHLGVSAGFRYTYNPDAAAGSRILTMTLEDADGERVAIDPAATYRVTANSFLTAGGDNFSAFTQGTGRLDTGQNDLQAMVEYLAAEEYVVPDPSERAIRQGQYKDDLITSFTIEAPEEIGPGERKTATVTIETSAAIPDELFSITFGFGVRVVGGPETCEVDPSFGLNACVIDGLPQGTTTIELEIAGESVGSTQPGFVAAFLGSPLFDFNPIEEPLQTGAELTVLDGELNGRQSDLDEDGVVDLLARNSFGQLLLYSGDGFGNFGRASLVGAGFTGQVVLPGDLNGDEIDDVVQLLNGYLVRFDGRGDGTLSRKGTVIGTGFSGAWSLVAPGDWNGDGLPDLLGRNAAGQLALFAGTPAGGIRNGVVIGKGWGAFTALVTPGDFDGDGTVDLLARTSANALFLYRGNGTGGFAGSVRIGTGWKFTSIVGLGDADSDLRPDLLATTATGDLFLYSGDGEGGFLGGARIGRGWSKLQLLG